MVTVVRAAFLQAVVDPEGHSLKRREIARQTECVCASRSTLKPKSVVTQVVGSIVISYGHKIDEHRKDGRPQEERPGVVTTRWRLEGEVA